MKSTDGLVGEVSAEDIRNYDIALVSGYAGGKPLRTDEGGPVKIVFPVTEHPELKDRYTFRSWQWFVCEVEFVRKQDEASSGEPVRQSAAAADRPLFAFCGAITGRISRRRCCILTFPDVIITLRSGYDRTMKKYDRRTNIWLRICWMN